MPLPNLIQAGLVVGQLLGEAFQAWMAYQTAMQKAKAESRDLTDEELNAFKARADEAVARWKAGAA